MLPPFLMAHTYPQCTSPTATYHWYGLKNTIAIKFLVRSAEMCYVTTFFDGPSLFTSPTIKFIDVAKKMQLLLNFLWKERKCDMLPGDHLFWWPIPIHITNSKKSLIWLKKLNCYWTSCEKSGNVTCYLVTTFFDGNFPIHITNCKNSLI